jgi:hypothetical protein
MIRRRSKTGGLSRRNIEVPFWIPGIHRFGSFRRQQKESNFQMYPPTVKIAPSILAADIARLTQQVAEAEKAGADRIHIDVMDGHFVPNISMGPVIVKSLRPLTALPLETHLMISTPDLFLEEFVEAGADSLLIHWEGNNNLHRTVQRVKALGKRAGVVINPADAGGDAGRNFERR